jgi:hypothetical protein
MTRDEPEAVRWLRLAVNKTVQHRSAMLVSSSI